MSDQDFFFDDEDAGASKQASKSGKGDQDKAVSAGARRPAGSGSVAPSFLERETTMTVASLLGVVGLLLGVIIGYVLAGVLTNPAVNVPAATVGTGAAPSGMGGAGGAAQPLTPEQINSGQLPAGHPQINSSGGGTKTTPGK